MSKKQAMRKNKRRGYSTYGAARVEQLLSQEPPKISIMTGVASSSGSSGERSAAARQRESEFRHRIMSDEKIGYVYRRDGKVIHEKTCGRAKEIPDGELAFSRELLPEMEVCPECGMKAYVRACGDATDYETYAQLFARLDLKTEQLRKLAMDGNASISATKNILTIQTGQDTWKLKSLDDPGHHLELLYRKNGAFYTVNSCVSVADALRTIEMYRWGSLRKALHAVRSKLPIGTIAQRILNTWVRRKQSMRKSVFYIDGDNDPRRRIAGIEHLSEKDAVKIFCAKNNSYYKDAERRTELRRKCACRLEFLSVESGPNAVDFAIAMDAYGTCARNPRIRVYLISGDKHFDTITKQLRTSFSAEQIGRKAESIGEIRKEKTEAPNRSFWNFFRAAIHGEANCQAGILPVK